MGLSGELTFVRLFLILRRGQVGRYNVKCQLQNHLLHYHSPGPEVPVDYIVEF